MPRVLSDRQASEIVKTLERSAALLRDLIHEKQLQVAYYNGLLDGLSDDDSDDDPGTSTSRFVNPLDKRYGK